MIQAAHSAYDSEPRRPWQVARSVLAALFLREAMARITASRLAWFWIFVEPLAHVALMVMLREFMGRIRFTLNADFIPWLIVGITAFILFRDGITRTLNAVDSNRALFAYRQVKPVDPVLVRVMLEGLIKTVVFILLLAGASLLGYDILPFDPLGAIFIWISIWLLGVGLGLVASVGAALAEEVGRVVRIILFPLYILSGVIIPLQAKPHYVQEILLYLPTVHGLELLRGCFFEGYHTLAGIDLLYLYGWIFASIALGLALHVKFATRLRAR
jgi:capsular polysaccharide transport system permease protein